MNTIWTLYEHYMNTMYDSPPGETARPQQYTYEHNTILTNVVNTLQEIADETRASAQINIQSIQTTVPTKNKKKTNSNTG